MSADREIPQNLPREQYGNSLRTKIISIDPHSRAEVDEICDTTFRYPLEDMDIEFFHSLTSEDIVIMDNSHRVFANSDVTVFFTEILPILGSGILYAIHDIALPNEMFTEKYYNEQYMLATYILGGAAGDEIYFPTGYINTYTIFINECFYCLDNPKFVPYNSGGFFWIKTNQRKSI